MGCNSGHSPITEDHKDATLGHRGILLSLERESTLAICSDGLHPFTNIFRQEREVQIMAILSNLLSDSSKCMIALRQLALSAAAPLSNLGIDTSLNLAKSLLLVGLISKQESI